MPVAPGTSSPLAILVSAPTLMSFSVESSSFSGRRRGAVGLWRGGAAACARGLVARPRCWLAEGQCSVDQFPQFVQSFARDRRDRQHGSFQHGFECSQGADPFAAPQLVDFGRDHRRRRRRPRASTATPRDRSRGPGAARRPAAARPGRARTPRARSPRTRPRSPAAPRPASPRRAPLSAPARSRSPADRAGRTARRRRASTR